MLKLKLHFIKYYITTYILLNIIKRLTLIYLQLLFTITKKHTIKFICNINNILFFIKF